MAGDRHTARLLTQILLLDHFDLSHTLAVAFFSQFRR
jgi:hypothetical protein